MTHALACLALHSVLSTKIVYCTPNTKLLNPIEAKNTNYSLREAAVVLSPPHKRRNTSTPSDDQWHDLQWQQDR